MCGIFPLFLPGITYIVQELGLVCCSLTGPYYRLSSFKEQELLQELPPSSMDYTGDGLFTSPDFMQRADNGVQSSLGTRSEAGDSYMYK